LEAEQKGRGLKETAARSSEKRRVEKGNTINSQPDHLSRKRAVSHNNNRKGEMGHGGKKGRGGQPV